jgi:ethanolamine utilization protein
MERSEPMDYNLLVDEILKRVSEKLAGLQVEESSTNKKQILLLTEEHGTKCHELLENKTFHTCYHMECALMKDYDCDLKDYDTVILYQLSNVSLGKLAEGICDTAFTSLASKAILMGKKIIIPTDGIELYQYEQSAPKVYFAMMNEKLMRLKDSGVILCEEKEIETILMGNCSDEECIKKETEVTKEQKSIQITKRVITESDLKKLSADGINCIHINSNAILTDLAKEYVHNRRIEIVRESTSEGKQRKIV